MNYIYLHGFCSGATSFKGNYFRERFAKRGLTLHCPDLNNDDFEHLTISSQLEVICDLAAGLSGELTVMGSSMGAYLAALFASLPFEGKAKNSRVKNLVLLAPAFRFLSRTRERMRGPQLEAWRESGFVEVFHYHYNENRRLAFDLMEDGEKYQDLPANPDVPALLLHGLQDEVVPYQAALEYMEQNPLSRLILLQDDHKFTAGVELVWRYMRDYLGLASPINPANLQVSPRVSPEAN